MNGFARRASALQLVWILVAAIFSATYFHPDEMHQTLELAAFKLGMLPTADMPWEFTREMRPWAQPAIYVVLMGGARAIGVTNPFALMALCRAATGVIGWIAARALLRATLPHVPEPQKRAHTLALTLLPCLPYLFVRTSSEMLSAAFLAGALAALGPSLAYTIPTTRSPVHIKRALLVGVLLGGAFMMRYQSAFFVAGLALWCAYASEKRIATFASVATSATLVVLVGIAIDAWGYGHLVFTPWNYARINLIEGVAKTFGTDPFFAYLYMLPPNLFAPLALLAMATTLLFCVRFPKHAFTWVVVPHFVAHSLIAHKEERFLFPLVTTCAAMIVPALALASPIGGTLAVRATRVSSWLWEKRTSVVARVFGGYSLAVGVLLSIYPLNVHAQTRMMHELYLRSPPRSWVLYTTNVEHAPLYRAPGSTWLVVPTLSLAVIRSVCERDPRPVFFITPLDEPLPFATPLFSDAPFGSIVLARRLTRVASFIRTHWIRTAPVPSYMTVHQADARLCR